MNKLKDSLVSASILLLTIILAVAGIWLLFPYQVMKVKSVKLISDKVKAGGTLTYDVSYCKYTKESAMVSKTLVNDILIPFSPYESNLPMGCSTKTVYAEIPDYAPTGEYHIHVSSSYRVNPIRYVSVNYETPVFTVVK